MMRILFVCTGNTCRSPMAEGILNAMKKVNNLDIEVASAGVAAFDGYSASDNSVLALEKMGIDISKHKSRLVDESLLDKFDLILTMSRSHKDILLNNYPNSKGNVFILNEYAFDEKIDIPDPFGGSLKDYERARDQIYRAIEKIVEKIGKKQKVRGKN